MTCAILAANATIATHVLGLLWHCWLVPGHHSIEELADKAERVNLIIVLPGWERE